MSRLPRHTRISWGGGDILSNDGSISEETAPTPTPSAPALPETNLGNRKSVFSLKSEGWYKSRYFLDLVHRLKLRTEFYDEKAGVDPVDFGKDMEGPTSLEEFTEDCLHLQEEVESLYSGGDAELTAFELCQIILKLTTLLSATVTFDCVAHYGGGKDQKKSSDDNNNKDGEDATDTQELGGDLKSSGGDELEKRINSNLPPRKKKSGVDSDKIMAGKNPTLHFDQMGYLLGTKFSEKEINDSMLLTLSHGKHVVDLKGCGSVQDDVQNNNGIDDNLNTLDAMFAITSKTRSALLSVAAHLLNRKDELETAQNSELVRWKRKKKKQSEQSWFSSLFGPPSEDEYTMVLILDWKNLLKMFLHTVPYLDTRNTGPIQMSFLKRQNPLQKETVHLISRSRKFFDQGLRPHGWDGEKPSLDYASRDVWRLLKKDLLPKTHPNSYFRALVLLYLFHPSSCSRSYYIKILPRWMERWTAVKQSPEVDFLWVVCYCRARKYVKESDFDWSKIKRHLDHVDPILESARWSDRVRLSRMSTTESSLFDDLSSLRPPSEGLEEHLSSLRSAPEERRPSLCTEDSGTPTKLVKDRRPSLQREQSDLSRAASFLRRDIRPAIQRDTLTNSIFEFRKMHIGSLLETEDPSPGDIESPQSENEQKSELRASFKRDIGEAQENYHTINRSYSTEELNHSPLTKTIIHEAREKLEMQHLDEGRERTNFIREYSATKQRYYSLNKEASAEELDQAILSEARKKHFADSNTTGD